MPKDCLITNQGRFVEQNLKLICSFRPHLIHYMDSFEFGLIGKARFTKCKQLFEYQT
jgi:hypothetical protein